MQPETDGEICKCSRDDNDTRYFHGTAVSLPDLIHVWGQASGSVKVCPFFLVLRFSL